MNALQLLILAGMLVAAGVATFVWWASPAEPDLADALDRISPHPATTAAPAAIMGDGTETVGLWALRRLPASRVATVVYLQPILAIALAMLIFGEPLRPSFLVASALVFGGVWTVHRH